MFRPTGFADLAGKRVGIFGYGIEGHATEQRLIGVAASVVIVDDDPQGGPVLATSKGGLDALFGCDVVLKSPGIPRRRRDVLDIERHGVVVTSALNLWLHDVERARVVAITGTKGKSTSTALITFFLTCLEEPSLRLGNFGQPPYSPDLDTSNGWLVLEVSSFQCVDIDVAPQLVLVTSLGSDHLDWHGSLENYHSDKLSLTNATGEHITVVPDDATFRNETARLGGELRFVAPDATGLATSLGLLGAHNDSNVALALHAVAQLTGRTPADVVRLVRPLASTFVPLRGRLTLVTIEATRHAPLRYVDDGLATSVLPSVAALEVFASEPVAMIVGGFDRGVDYLPLAEALAARRTPTTVLTMGDAGQRIAEALRRLCPEMALHSVATMREAVTRARAALPKGGVVLLSPAAPSFDHYRNWEERSDDFTAVVKDLAGH